MTTRPKSTGLDAVVSYPTDFGAYGHVDWSLSANFNTTKVTKVKSPPASLLTASVPYPTGQTMFSKDAKSLLEKASPKYKIGLNGLYRWADLTVSVTETFYGESSSFADPGSGPLQQTSIGALAITDVEVSYKLPLDVTVSMGASNLFNKYPDKLSPEFVAACVASGSGCVAQYPSYSPIGINGGYYYGRLTWNF